MLREVAMVIFRFSFERLEAESRARSYRSEGYGGETISFAAHECLPAPANLALPDLAAQHPGRR